MRIFCESFSLGFLLNQTLTYQDNPCGVYPDLSSLSGGGVIQNFVTYIKRSAPSKDHIMWYQSFGSCYRFYPIQFLFFSFVICVSVSCLRLVCILVAFLFASCCVLVCVLIFVLVIVFVFFKFNVKKNKNYVSNFVWGQFGLRENFGGLGFSRPLNFSYLFVRVLNELPN